MYVHYVCPGTYGEVYDMYPPFTPLVQAFAKEHKFEIHDIYEDELCVYRAMSDQFMINGCPGHTELSLRETVFEKVYILQVWLFKSFEMLNKNLKSTAKFITLGVCF